jgi:hypothetical protein
MKGIGGTGFRACAGVAFACGYMEMVGSAHPTFSEQLKTEKAEYKCA